MTMNNDILVQMSESDRRLTVIVLVIFVVLLFLVGLLGMLIRFIDKKFAYRMDAEIHEAIRYGAITDKKILKKYGMIKNFRVFYKQVIPALLVLLVCLIFWIVYSSTTGGWSIDHFSRFSTVMFNFDWSNPENFANFFGLTLPCRWPPLISSPNPVPEFWASYVIIPLFIGGLVYFFVVSWAFTVRYFQLRKRCRTVFNKSLDGYNYYDHVNAPKVLPNTQMEPFDNNENR